MFTSSELAEMREMSRRAMTDSCLLVRNGTFANNTYGDDVETPSACRRAPIGITPEEQRMADANKEVILEKYVVPFDVNVDGVARVKHAGITHKVVGVLPDRTNFVERHVIVSRDANTA